MASKKRGKPGNYSYDDDEDYVPSADVHYSSKDNSAPKKKKAHTLDSDEELDEDNDPQDVLKEDDITGKFWYFFAFVQYLIEKFRIY